MAKAQPEWEKYGWIRGERLVEQQGNQAHTFLARKSTDDADQYSYILKKLRRQDDLDRRAMFYAETAAMGALDHSGVLKIEATNADNYKSDAELFLVTKRVQGSDLENLVLSGIVFEDAIRVVIGTLEILDHCHKRSVIHRDIKPCHILVSESNFDCPTLIDFGLAYNEELSPTEAATKDDEGKGNRFLIGPEHLVGRTIANRSPSTDICQSCGLLFFALKGRSPGILLDENRKKPHQRYIEWKSEIDLPQWKREYLEVIFDKAFEWHPDNRWIDIPQLIQKLKYLLETSESPNEKLKIQAAKLVNSSNIADRISGFEKAVDLSNKTIDMCSEVVSAIDSETSDMMSVKCKNYGQENELRSVLIHFVMRAIKRKEFTIRLQFVRKPKELTVLLTPYTGNSSIFENGREVVLGCLALEAGVSSNEIRHCLEEKLLVCMKELLDSVS